jgi:hypothetical protein
MHRRDWCAEYHVLVLLQTAIVLSEGLLGLKPFGLPTDFIKDDV